MVQMTCAQYFRSNIASEFHLLCSMEGLQVQNNMWLSYCRQNLHFRLSYSLKKSYTADFMVQYQLFSDVILLHLRCYFIPFSPKSLYISFLYFYFQRLFKEYIVKRITLESLATHAAKYNTG